MAKYLFLPSRGKQAWQAAQICHAEGIVTPFPVALLERRVGPFLMESVLVSEYLPDLKGFLSWYKEQFTGPLSPEAIALKRIMIRRLAETVAGLHNAGIRHGDLKKNNIMLRGKTGNKEFVVLDLENAAIRDVISTPDRLEDLGCLAYSLVRYTRLADRLRFLRRYCELSGIPAKAMTRLIKEISQWIDRKIDRKIRRDHDWEWARKILVVRNDNIGDVLCTTPALDALRKAYPKAHIAVLVARYTKDAVEGNPFIDRVYSYQKAKHAGFAGESKWNAWVAQVRMIREIRKEKFDLAIGIRSKFTPSLGWLAFASGAPVRVGRRPRPKDKSLAFFFNVFVDEEQKPAHEVERAMNVVRRIGVDVEDKRLNLFVSEEDREAAARFIREHGLKQDKKLVCLHLTARPEEDRWWLPENYVKLARHLMGRADVDMVLNWTAKDQELADRVMAGLDVNPPVFFASGLKPFAAFVKECDLFITLEGGAMHISAAVGTPTLAIFGATSDVVWRPWGEKNVTLRGGDHANSVKPETVIKAADHMLVRLEITG